MQPRTTQQRTATPRTRGTCADLDGAKPPTRTAEAHPHPAHAHIKPARHRLAVLLRPRVGRLPAQGRIGRSRWLDPVATRTPLGTLATISSYALDTLQRDVAMRAASGRCGGERPHEPGPRLGRVDDLVDSAELDRAVQAADRPLVLGESPARTAGRSSSAAANMCRTPPVRV